MRENTSKPLGERRLRKLLRFVAVVWALGIAYKLLEHGGSLLLRSSLDAGVVDSGWVVPTPSDPEACAAAVAGLESRTLDEAARRAARRRAWELGLDLGRRRAWRVEQAWGEEPRRLPRPENRAALAAALEVPLPEAPEARNPAHIFNEFSFHLANDRGCVAARLAALHGPESAHLYRFGAVAGQAAAFRQLGLAQGSAHAEIRHYAGVAKVPEELWSPLTRELAGEDAEARAREVERVLQALRAWLDGGE